MTEVVCPGLPAGWVNAWLAAVGIVVLDDRIRLHWTTAGSPVVVLTAEALDPIAALVESWPNAAVLDEIPIAEGWQGAANLQRRVPVEEFTERARSARSHRHSWTLSSTMTDLSVDRQGEVAHAPFDPAGPGTIKWLHHRLVKVHGHVEPTTARIRVSLEGRADRVKDNGLGFDLTRIGSLSDSTDRWVDPVIETLAFFGLALLPVRGRGTDARLDRRTEMAAQRGWRRREGSRELSDFHWPAWRQPLDSDGVDALMDLWNPERKDTWARVGVHAAWRSVQFQRTGSSDVTRGFGAERL